jgi:glycosyltransferase involved in cell wall biosynthesis
MHIGIFIYGLCAELGGLQKFGAELAGVMLARGHQVTAFYHWSAISPPVPASPLASGVRQCALDMSHADMPANPNFALNRDKLLASDIDVFVPMASTKTFMHHPALVHTTGIPLLMSEHFPPQIINQGWNPSEHHACLAAADRIHLLLPSFAEQYPEFLRERTRIIPCPVNLQGFDEKPAQSKPVGNILLSVGRFKEGQKRFSLLIKAFSLLAADFPDWKLVLCGMGKSRELYENLIQSLRLSERVALPGMVPDLTPYYSGSELFCIPSLFEAMPSVLLEAYSFGLPAVGFVTCPGVNENIIHNENGLLAEEMTAESLARQLAVLMGDESLRRKFGQRAKELVSRYDSSGVYDQWEALLEETASCKGATRLQRMGLPRTEEEQCLIRLREILCRPAPFARCNFQETINIKKQRNKDVAALQKILKEEQEKYQVCLNQFVVNENKVKSLTEKLIQHEKKIAALNKYIEYAVIVGEKCDIGREAFPSSRQKIFLSLIRPCVKLFASPEYYIKLCLDPSDLFAATKNPFLKLCRRLLKLVGPTPKKTSYKTVLLG